MFGEEYTLVAVSDYVLGITPGNTVSNLSSSRALSDITIKHGGKYYSSAVGEVNVVAKMKECKAVIGGEGNGGVIYPPLHYGRDALAGIALFLTSLAKSGMQCSQLRATFPNYYIVKNKMELKQGVDIDKLLNIISEKFKEFQVDTTDGVKVDFDDGWVHLRKSNTEPVIRIYAESKTSENAVKLIKMIFGDINNAI